MNFDQWYDTGAKQGCLLSATLFGLLGDGLEQHLVETLGLMHLTYQEHYLLLYASDLIILLCKCEMPQGRHCIRLTQVHVVTGRR